MNVKTFTAAELMAMDLDEYYRDPYWREREDFHALAVVPRLGSRDRDPGWDVVLRLDGSYSDRATAHSVAEMLVTDVLPVTPFRLGWRPGDVEMFPNGIVFTGYHPPSPPRRSPREILILALRERDGDSCHVCAAPLDGDAVIDHVIPLARGGPDEFANLKLTHRLCNSRKGARLLVGTDSKGGKEHS